MLLAIKRHAGRPVHSAMVLIVANWNDYIEFEFTTGAALFATPPKLDA